MLKITQWVNVPRGASGSSQIKAKLRVPAGGSGHLSGGERLRPSPVYCLGMGSPSRSAVLVSCNVMRTPPVNLQRSMLESPHSGVLEAKPLAVGSLRERFDRLAQAER